MFFIYSKFKLRNWRRYNSSKRLRILQALENKMAKKQNRTPIDVIVHERADWNCLGMFVANSEQKNLIIHENLILNPAYRFHALETIIHEGRHATQYFMVTRKKIPWWNIKAKRWKKNFEGYVSASEDKLIYNNQEVERDAQKYTIKWLEKLAYKYQKESDFQTTLERNLHRYESSDEKAREKYGVFYKQKLRKKIEERSQY